MFFYLLLPEIPRGYASGIWPGDMERGYGTGIWRGIWNGDMHAENKMPAEGGLRYGKMDMAAINPTETPLIRRLGGIELSWPQKY